MDYKKKLVSLLLRNEEWLLSKILHSTREYKQHGYAALINHSWRELAKKICEIIDTSPNISFNDLKKTSLLNLQNNAFKEIGISEAEKSNQRGIKPGIYLAFLKKIRDYYLELIFDSPLNSQEKNDFTSMLNNCFDSLEIAFVTGLASNERETTIAPSEKINEAIFKNVAIPALLIDSFHKIVGHNQAAEKFFSILHNNQNKDLNSLRFENDGINLKIDEFRASKNLEGSFETNLTINNKILYLLVVLNKITHSDRILVTFIDYTKWKEAEQNLEYSKQKAENSDNLKTTFLANMSHEIRTPLNAIVGFAELLTMSNPGKEERKEYFCLIKKSSNDLLNIIEDIIDIAKIESKQLKICPKNITLFELFTDLERIYSEQILRHGKEHVKILLKVPENEKKLVFRTDPKRLKQVLSNLIGNALKFTDSGTIEIGYKISENKFVYFFVKDTGIGIPKEMLKKVFDRFVQVEDTYHKNTNGTGLGLAISRNIVNLLGGNIWVTSQNEKGSNFYFYLPLLYPTEKSIPVINKEEYFDTEVDLNNSNVLIAEDEDTNFYYLREALKSTGINIIRAKNGLEAINQVETNDNIHIILMDIKMPEVSGLEASRYIAHIKPELPIIALTAFAMDNDRQTCLNAGCIDYIAKPLTREKLISIIKKYISKKGMKAAQMV